MNGFNAAACLAAMSLLLTHAKADVRYQCKMADDSVKLVVQNLIDWSPRAVKSCLAVKVLSMPMPSFPVDDEFLGDEAVANDIIDIEGPAVRPRPSVPLAVARPKFSTSADARRAGYQGVIDLVARRHGLDPRLVDLVVHVESRHQADARSPKGAMGLMQVLPSTAAQYGVTEARRLLDPSTNLDVGSRYLKYLLKRFDGRLDLALAAYNSGEGNVMKYGWRVPPFAETKAYVRDILGGYLGKAS